MLPRKIFENLHAVMAILVLFESFSGKLCLNFLTLILSALLNMMHFVRTFLIMRAKGVRLIAIEEVWYYRKIVYIKNIFENGWWQNAYPSSYPSGFAPVMLLCLLVSYFYFRIKPPFRQKILLDIRQNVLNEF